MDRQAAVSNLQLTRTLVEIHGQIWNSHDQEANI